MLKSKARGTTTCPPTPRHLIITQIRARLERLGWHLPGLRLKAINRIPHSRGLGSSAAAHIAAALAVKALLPPDCGVTQQHLLQWASEAEGHPDNVAPAVYGGLTFSWHEPGETGKQYRSVQLSAHPDITPVVAIPSQAAFDGRSSNPAAS